MSDTLEIAKKCGLLADFSGPIEFLQSFREEIEKLERERCAKVCESLHYKWKFDDEPDSDSGPRDCAEAIRKGDKL